MAITKHQAETQMSRIYEEQAAILLTAMDGFWIVDMKGRLVEVNDAYCRMSGYTRDELLRMSIADFESNESKEEIATHIQQVMQDGCSRFERQHRHKNGHIIDVELSVNYLPTCDGRFFVTAQVLFEGKKGRPSRAWRRYSRTGRPCLRRVEI
jgi:PAS domain S-box-containing protein